MRYTPPEHTATALVMLLACVQAHSSLDLRWRVTLCFPFLLSRFLVCLLTSVSTICPEFRLTFGGGPYYPLPPTFLLRSFCLHVASYFLHSTTAYLRNCAQNTVSFLRSLNPQLRHWRHQAHCSHNVSPWSFSVPFLCCCPAVHLCLLFLMHLRCCH